MALGLGVGGFAGSGGSKMAFIICLEDTRGSGQTAYAYDGSNSEMGFRLSGIASNVQNKLFHCYLVMGENWSGDMSASATIGVYSTYSSSTQLAAATNIKVVATSNILIYPCFKTSCLEFDISIPNLDSYPEAVFRYYDQYGGRPVVLIAYPA